jgi:aminoglycoside phosphotransferase (APT) family kinase protein
MTADGTRVDGDLLDERTAVPYLVRRGVLADPDARATMLGGGVSNVVLRVDGDRPVVLKQALPRLRVQREWLADPSRAQAEASALAVLHALSPDAVPAPLDSDAIRHTLTIEAAPPDWRDWKTRLMAGDIRPWIAERLGRLLGFWHTATAGAPLPDELEGAELFEQLRLAPYFGVAGERRPELRARLEALADDIRARRSTFVHGDFSPKNVLVGDDALWVIDLEVGHRGDPAFDVAFLLTHLAGKTAALPSRAAEIADLARAFLAGYRGAAGVADPRHTARVLAGLLIARAYGSSPLEYLNPAVRERLAARAVALLDAPAPELFASWEDVTR